MSYYFNASTYPLWIGALVVCGLLLWIIQYTLHHKRKLKKYLNYVGTTGVYTSALGLGSHAAVPKLQALFDQSKNLLYAHTFSGILIISLLLLIFKKQLFGRKHLAQKIVQYFGLSGALSSALLMGLQSLSHTLH